MPGKQNYCRTRHSTVGYSTWSVTALTEHSIHVCPLEKSPSCLPFLCAQASHFFCLHEPTLLSSRWPHILPRGREGAPLGRRAGTGGRGCGTLLFKDAARQDTLLEASTPEKTSGSPHRHGQPKRVSNNHDYIATDET